MKKWIALILALVMVLGIVGCSSSGAEELQKNDSPVAAEEKPAVAAEDYQQVMLNQKVEYKGIEVVFHEATVANKIFIPTGKSNDSDTVTNLVNVVRPVVATEGNTLVIVSGTVKNIGNEEAFLNGNVFSELLIEDAVFKCLVRVVTAEGRTMGLTSITPLMEASLYFAAEIPEELAERFTACDIVFGFFKDGFDTNRMGASLNNCEIKYMLSVSKDNDAENRITVRTVEPIEYKLGDSISTDTIELCLTKIELASEMTDKYKGKHYGNSQQNANEGTHNICLTGSIMSKATIPLWFTDFSGNVEIDGYTYELKTWTLDCYPLQPMIETKVYIFANVSDYLLENLKTCTVRFAFNEEMTNKAYEYDECDYIYELTFGKEDISNPL